MKTATFNGVSPESGRLRLGLRSVIVIAALAASNLFGQPTVKTLGGGASGSHSGYQNGETINALFDAPMGLAMSESGDLFVADYRNNAIRELSNLTGTGNGTTITWATNSINAPVGVAVDADGNLFVLNRGGTGAFCTNGTVLEFDEYGILIATIATHLTNAAALALDPSDNIYVTERTNLLIKITLSPATETAIATITNANAFLEGVACLPSGNLAVCDYARDGIYTVNPNTAPALITTNAGFNGQGDGTGPGNIGIPNSMAQFFQPCGVASAGDGTLIVSDFGNDRVKVVTVAGVTTNLYGVSSNDWVSPYPGWMDGSVVVPDEIGGVASRCPVGVALAPSGSTVYTSEDYYHIIRQTTGTAFAQFVTPPPTPTGLTAMVVTNAGTVEVALTWSPITTGNVTNYLVERSTSSGGPYTIIGNTGATTSFTDANILAGTTYYYVIQAENSGGESSNSSPASVTIPIPPPPAPNIGWYDFEGNVQNGLYSTMHPVSAGNPYVANNPLLIAIDPTETGLSTRYITIPPYTNNTPVTTIVNNGSTPPVYENDQLDGSPNVNPLPSLTLSNGLVTIEAVNVNGVNEPSAVSSASFEFEMGTPTITGNNPAQFTVSDVSTNVTFFYTLDGSDPTNAPASQQVYTTNGIMTLSLNGSTNIYFEVRAIGNGPEADYLMSGAASWIFTPGTFVPNTISWGFAQGECSSAFIGAAGQTFYAPVTLTMLPGTPLYSLQFNMTVSTTGAGVTNPAPASELFNFQSMLLKPIPGSSPPAYTPIPPWMFAAYETEDLPPSDYITNGGQVFVNLVTSNGNELAVGWVERYEETNLYNTLQQTLISYSQAHDDMFPSAAQGEPNGVIVGAYGVTLSASATNNGMQYQIQLGQASGTADGIGAPGEGVDIYAPDETNSTALGAGTLNAIKNITIASIPYLVGNVYPFRWFNAGDFGNSTLQNADVEQVFEAAAYDVNKPIYDSNSLNSAGGYTNVSDMYDAMDSCGQLGAQDMNQGDEFYGYYTNAGPLTIAQQEALLNGNITNINLLAFGDGQLDICDVYVTFLRSEFTNNYVWFQRLWTNGVRVATATSASGIISEAQSPSQYSESSQAQVESASPDAAPICITNTPFINFTATDSLASAGQTITIPINATVFGPYPARMMLLNISVVPLDGSPALTVPIQFAPSAALGSAFGSSTPTYSGSSGNGNCSVAWMPNSLDLTQVPGFTNTANIGTLSVTIPANATSMSSYAIHFDKASASPSGLLSLPNRILFTGLITLSSRTNSYYNDGIPDSWRLRYFGTIYNELSVSNADADGTSMDNWQKYQAGLNPMDSTSVLNEGTDQAMAQNQQDLVLYWPTVNGQTYIVKRSATLFPPQWTAISTNIGDGTYMEIHDTSGGNTRYYQVTTPQ